MARTQRILVVLERDESDGPPEPALQRAVFLAGEMRASLHLLLSDYNPAQNSRPSLRRAGSSSEEYMRGARDWLEAMAEPLRKQGLRVSTDLAWDRHQYHAIMEKAAALRPDMVVKTTRHDTTLNRTLFNYTDWQLIRSCPSSLLLAKNEGDWSTRRIVACVNPAHVHSEAETLDDAIIEAAQMLAYRLKGELHVFHSIEAWPHLRPLPGAETWLDARSMEQIAGEHRDLVEDLLRPYGIRERVHFVVGRPAKTLVPFIEEIDASLVVMGAVSKGALEALLVGNTAERVLDALRCDILIVKSQPLEVRVAEPALCAV